VNTSSSSEVSVNSSEIPEDSSSSEVSVNSSSEVPVDSSSSSEDPEKSSSSEIPVISSPIDSSISKPESSSSEADDLEGSCGDHTFWKLNEGVLTINGTGKMTNFSASNRAPWRKFQSLIESIVVEERVTSIGSNAFAECTNLTNVAIGESVASIGQNAFSGCSSLKSVFYMGANDLSSSRCFDESCTALESVCVSTDYKYEYFCEKVLTSSSEACQSFRRKFNYCSKAVYQDGVFVEGKRSYAAAWEARSNGCVKYVCNGTALTSETLKTCNDAPTRCHSAKCNEKSGQCEYKPVNGFDQMKKLENQCYEAACDGTSWVLQKRESVAQKEESSTGCVTYECVNETGIKTVLQTCGSDSCYVSECNETTFQCESRPNDDYYLLKEQENHCYELACGEHGWVVQKRDNVTQKEDSSSGCVKYECVNETGMKTVLLTCDADPCHVSECNETTAQCESRLKDGYDQLKELENKCYEVVCGEDDEWVLQKKMDVMDYEDRQAHCVVYVCDNATGKTETPIATNCMEGPACHTSKCDESTGGCIYEKYDGYDELAKFENHCFEVVCNGTGWVLQKRQNATNWESQTDGCRQYQCSNTDGPVSWSLCNSTRSVGNRCVDGECQPVICPAGQYQSYGFCYNCSSILSCATCSNAISCDTCQDGFKLADDGTCKRDCASFGDGCTECTAKKCLECTKKDCCQLKKHFWNSVSNSCEDPADVFGVGCLEANDTECTLCTAATCCHKKEFFDYGKASCQPCSEYGDDCKACNAAGCIDCDNGKVVGTDGATCMSCSDVFGEGCESCEQTGCSEAKTGYTLIRTYARKCSELFGQHCEQCNTDGCTQCSEGYKPFGGYCKTCSEVFGEGCEDCSIDECESCDSNKILINGVCADCSSAYGEGCLECSTDSNCTVHDFGYFVYAGFAISCDVLPEIVQPYCYMEEEPPSLRSQRDSDEGVEVEVEYFNKPYPAACSEIVQHCTRCNNNATCSECEEGFYLFAPTECRSCSEKFGDSCKECSFTSCLACADEDDFILSGHCQSCQTVNPHCSVCSEGFCSICEEPFVEKDGLCTTCQKLYGTGCNKCNSTHCLDCVEATCCLEGSQLIVKTDSRFCSSTCDDLTENCVECTSTQCLKCKGNLVPDTEDSYKCKDCSELFVGCSICDSFRCKECRNTTWVKTDNGCVVDDDIEILPESSSSSQPESSHHTEVSSSRLIVPSSSATTSGKSNAGLIAGIVVAAVVIAAVVAVSIYCFVTSGPKRGKIDPEIYEKDIEFVSMSMI